MLQHLSGRPTGVGSEDKISVVLIAEGGTTGGVIEGELTRVQTGNRLQFHRQSRHGAVRETL